MVLGSFCIGLVAFLAFADAERVITRDVCILGGGSSGTYAAIRLKDRGKTVVIVEPKDVLGGHAETQYFPDGRHIDYGVEGVFRNDLSTKYLQRLGVEYQSLLPNTSRIDYVDFRTGQSNSSHEVSGFLELLPQIVLYRLALNNFDYLRKGLFNEIPEPVPETLLQPFREFASRNQLQQPLLDLIFTFASGVGNVLDTPLLYVLQNFGIPHVEALLSGYVKPVKGMNEVYRRAEKIIGTENILFGAKAREVTRRDDGGAGIVISVMDKKGQRYAIHAKQLLVAMPLTAENTAPLLLDESDRALFRKWKWSNYYAAVIKTGGLPDKVDIANEDPTQKYSFPLPPFQWRLQYMGVPGYHISKIVADSNFEPRKAHYLILTDILRMKSVYPVQTPEIVAFADHSPTSLSVSVEHLRAGFYRRLYALQGRADTFYTGNSLCSDYSSLLWAYTDEVIDLMVGRELLV
ncbi:hypothetical protein XA68_15855 [Ophiocordyceps unilateralis]|uniref:Amine oxidase domain-containing protein n=1 Tax=Ophiocordyceps unilateralis TaxID=268505 RepID=A0A2A9P693_OPHUN|nr:hypothetical protein XA68_15855 [Ophiocordyceps unilateralis]